LKGLIVEKQARCTIVLTPSGEYKKIRGTVKGEVGQEVTVSPCFAVPKAAVLAAVLVIALLLSQAMPVMLRQNEAYAYVTLDINPSAEFAIDADDIVLSAHPYNQAAEEILADMMYRGKGIGPVLADFTQSAISRQYIGSGRQNYVVVSYYSEHTKDEQAAEAELMRMIEAQRQVLKSSGQEADINTVIVDEKTRKEARKLGVSAGRLEEMEQERKMDKDSPDELIPAGEAEGGQSSSSHKNKDNSLKGVQLKIEKSKGNKKEKADTDKEENKNRKKLKTNYNALKGNFKQARKEEMKKPSLNNNGNKVSLNEPKPEFNSIHKGEKGKSKEVKQKEGDKKSQGKYKDKNKKQEQKQEG
jgi:hypothetical protein